MKTFKEYYSEGQEDVESVALLAGGFKPPTRGHFMAFNYLLNDVSTDADRGIVYVGKGDRELIKGDPSKGVITQEQAIKIWQIYAKYLGKPVEIKLSPKTPVKDVYDYADANFNKKLIVGGGGPREISPGEFDEGDMKRWNYFIKNQEKYPLVQVVEIPPQEQGMRGTDMRRLLADNLDAGIEAFVPQGENGISESDKDKIKSILSA